MRRARESARDLIDRYGGDPIEIIKKISGVTLTESEAIGIAVDLGPMSVEITCPGSVANRLYEKISHLTVGKDESSKSFISHIPGEDGKRVYFIIYNANHTNFPREFRPFNVWNHERQHVRYHINREIMGIQRRPIHPSAIRKMDYSLLNRLRRKLFNRSIGDPIRRDYEAELLDQYHKWNPNKREKAFYISEYLRSKREDGLDKAKDEILALCRDGRSLDPTSDLWMIFFNRTPPYDYLKSLRESEDMDRPIYQSVAQEILVDEYREIIERAIVSMNDLVKCGLHREDVVAFLTFYPLSRWPKVAARYKSNRLSRNKWRGI